MRTQYKTQCPRCKTIYPMPAEKLDQPKARANCGKCHHTFFLNANILKPTDESFQPKPVTTEVNSGAVQTIAQSATPTAPAPSTQTAQTTPEVPPAVTVPTGIISAQQAVANAQKQSASELLNKEKAVSEPAPTKTTNATPEMDYDGLDEFLKGDVVATPTKQEPVKAEPDPFAAVPAAPTTKQNTNNAFGSEFAKIPTAAAAKPLDKEQLQRRAEQRLAGNSPSQEKIAKQRSVFGQLMWLVGCIGLLVLMAGQYIIFNADEIAKHPSQVGILSTLCQSVACNLPKADPNAFSNAYELQAVNADTNLIGTLKNNSGEDQLYPNLKISVYGGNGQLLGDFVATPKDYLTTEQRLLSANQGKRYMFTLPNVMAGTVGKVNIEPFY